jgi:WD40 repeat protein
MVRWLAMCILFCALTSGAVFLLTDPYHLWAGTTSPPKTPKPQSTEPMPMRAEGVTIRVLGNDETARESPIVLPPGTVTPINKQEVPSERPGKILFIARELRPNEEHLKPQILPLGKSKDKYFSLELKYVATILNPPAQPKEGEPAPPPQPLQFRRWQLNERLEWNRVCLEPETRYFRELGVGDRVEKGEVLAIVNPTIALDEVDVKSQKLKVAKTEIDTSAATKDEAWARWDGMEKACLKVIDAYSREERRGAKLTYFRYVQEEIAKTAAYTQAQRELNASITQLHMHEIRAHISGILKTVYKSRGDAVKELDPVLQLQDFDHLRVESVMEAQYANQVKVNQDVLIEPTIADAPRKVLNGHLQEVTCIAVTNGQEPLILSGSEDRTVRVWDPKTGDQKAVFTHMSPVRSLACTGKGAEASLAVVGCSDGSVRLFDMDKLRDPNVEDKKTAVKELPRKHTRSITCAAFSPNGKVCATGSEDLTICLWDVETGELLDKPLPAHKSPVTSVQFASDDTFVSAGRDNTWDTWKFEKGKAPVRQGELDKRSGDVTQLGVFQGPDGKAYGLFDDAKDLRILSLDTRQAVASIQNAAGVGFKGLALFAPDGKTVLTTSATENRMQLWRTPDLAKKDDDKKKDPKQMARGRASELRQFVWSTGRENAAAFAPEVEPGKGSAFIVTGTKDNQVLIWAMPEPQQIDGQLWGKVSLVEQSLDASSRQVRIWAEVDNKYGWLIPGGTATIVIPPPEKK